MIWDYLGERFTPGWNKPTKLETVLGMLKALGYFVAFFVMLIVAALVCR